MRAVYREAVSRNTECIHRQTVVQTNYSSQLWLANNTNQVVRYLQLKLICVNLYRKRICSTKLLVDVLFSG
jgi:hypothetical protein